MWSPDLRSPILLNVHFAFNRGLHENNIDNLVICKANNVIKLNLRCQYFSATAFSAS